jgi:uncharacterized membrane protein YedE/YeeE
MVVILLFGALFGIIIQYAGLNKFNVISGQAMLKDNRVAKTLILAIGLGAILLSIIIGLDLAHFHIKPFVVGGIVLGGLIFGSGMAILGYCPGTLAVSLGEGSLDALVGIIGGLLGGLVFTLLLPNIQWILGPNLGKIDLFSAIGSHHFVYYFIVIVAGATLIYSAFLIDRKENNSNKRWVVSGVSLALLNGIVFLSATTNRPIGASTSYPYIADLLTNTTANNYFEKIQTPGNWEMIFLFGAMTAAFLVSFVKRDFKLRLIQSEWEEQKGNSSIKRIFWAFVGGFILIFGARMAGGCTSGHILSGGMQLAASSLVFALFVFIGMLATAKIFYSKK